MAHGTSRCQNRNKKERGEVKGDMATEEMDAENQISIFSQYSSIGLFLCLLWLH